VKPSRRECRLIAAYLWLLTRVLFFAQAAAGALRTRHSLRPLTFRGSFAQHLGPIRVAGMRCCVFSPSPRPYGEKVGMRSSFHGLCTSSEPLTHPASLRSTGRPLPAREGRGDSKRFALGCLNTESIHVIPAKRALASADPGPIRRDGCCSTRWSTASTNNHCLWLWAPAPCAMAYEAGATQRKMAPYSAACSSGAIRGRMI
jgi:hypothetical protein